MGYLSREAILAADDIPTDDVEVPEWGGTVRIRALSGTDRDRMEADIVGNGKKPKMDNLRAKVVAASVIDEEGHKMFAESDVVALGRKSAAALGRVFDAAASLAAIKPADVEELAGNSEPDQSEGSPSDWPGTSVPPLQNSWHESTLAS